jgi:16S rRNA G1207 methylase RsmC
MGEKLKFNLSLGLFSSHSIDAGTRLLLKTIAQQKILPDSGAVLDSGCGTGVIAVSLKKRFPQLDITAADRDALALKFTGMNAALNKLPVEGFSITSGFLPGSFDAPFFPASSDANLQKFKLIISNIPAKAGTPVLNDFLSNCGYYLTDGGRAAVVIVATLADAAEKSLIESGADITFKEADKQYTVFHFIPAQKKNRKREFSDIYLRTKTRISGFHGLPEFDSVSYQTKIVLETLNKYKVAGDTIFWNPGTGHIPAALEASGKHQIKSLTLAGNDLLQLFASEYNIKKIKTRMLHLPSPAALSAGAPKNSADFLIANPVIFTGAGIVEELISAAAKLLRKGGKLLVSGKSSDMARLAQHKAGFSEVHSMKYRGFRVLLLEKLS